jgi:indole-3-glycerol phosphate synthase
MSDKLTEIMAWKRREIAAAVRAVPLTRTRPCPTPRGPRPPSFAAALRRADGRLAVIAEIKRRSPSAGDIGPGPPPRPGPPVSSRRRGRALSVLTDEKFFGGTLDDLRRHRASSARTARPCLPAQGLHGAPIQVLEARAAGASAILIIVRALTDEEIRQLQAAATAAGLDALFEIHNEPELARAAAPRRAHHRRQQPRPRHLPDRPRPQRATDPPLSARRHRRERKRHPHRADAARVLPPVPTPSSWAKP